MGHTPPPLSQNGMHPARLAIIKYWTMAQIALHPWLQAPEARTGTYNGAEDGAELWQIPTAELEALRTGCGVFALAWRGRINVSGKDRVRWLHNMVTNNVRDLPVNRGNYNFVLNAQGRILGDMYIYNRGESFALETDASQVQALLCNAMKRFIIMDKVELVEIGADSVSIGICGPKAESVLSTAGITSAACSHWKCATWGLTIDSGDSGARSGTEDRVGLSSGLIPTKRRSCGTCW